jgi:hypothetical protein
MRYQAILFPDDEPIKNSKYNQIELSDVIRYYEGLASAHAKNPIYFAEKFLASGDVGRALSNEPKAKFVCLVRDPRDVFLSARSFDERRGYRGFQERDGESPEAVILKYKQSYEKLIRNLDLSGAYLIRYEDLVADPIGELSALWEGLNLECSRELVEITLKCAMASELGNGRHRTSELGTVFRWQREMPEALRSVYRQEFECILKQFRYLTY